MSYLLQATAAGIQSQCAAGLANHPGDLCPSLLRIIALLQLISVCFLITLLVGFVWKESLG